MQIITLYRGAKFIFLISALTCISAYFYQNRMPSPDFYHGLAIAPPEQTPTNEPPFTLVQNEQSYRIIPKFQYALTGVVVSYSNADGFTNIWHHQRFKDFINLRDICVIWGNNVTSGVYKKIHFSSDSWTCWSQWQNPAVQGQFSSEDLSNNHLLTDDVTLKLQLLGAHIGDVVRFSGYLVDYENTTSGTSRHTSTTRKDRGNGACEVVFLDSFDIIKEAHPVARQLFWLSKWGMLITGILWLVLLPKVPYVRKRHD